MSEDFFFFNGIDGASGEFLLPPLSPAQISAIAQGQSLDADELAQLKLRAFELQNPHAGVEADARDLTQTGWGVVFAHDADPAIQEALNPLLQLRQRQAGQYYKEFTGVDGYRQGESKLDFLVRHGMGPGPVAPEQVPYYLLLVGDPQTIPYRFQCQLDVQYAVGRIHFDSLEEYDSYARSVVAAETGLSLSTAAAFFGVANEDDRATNLSLENLIAPLAEKLSTEGPRWAESERSASAWEVQTIFQDEATKAHLSELMNGSKAPSLFFSASHGIAFPTGDTRQLPHQGALICQDWPGPAMWRGPLQEDHYFSGDDLASDANLLGMIAFFFACYGAGTPQHDEFARQVWPGQAERQTIAPHAFVSRLPQRMLSLPRGGALAVIGHVERAWGSSFFWGRAGKQLTVFEDTLERLLRGNYPVGYAMEVFNNRYAEISTDLSSRIDDARFGMRVNDLEMANLWTANNDARNYIVLGDPAVRLPVSGQAATSRPVLESLALSSATSPNTTAVDPSSPGAAGSPSEAQALTTQPAPVGPDFTAQAAPDSASSPGVEGHFEVPGSQGLLDHITQLLQVAGPLEVATYTIPDEAVAAMGGTATGDSPGAKLVALTRLLPDGSLRTYIAEGCAQNAALLKTHQESVAGALTQRAAIIQAAALLPIKEK